MTLTSVKSTVSTHKLQVSYQLSPAACFGALASFLQCQHADEGVQNPHTPPAGHLLHRIQTLIHLRLISNATNRNLPEWPLNIHFVSICFAQTDLKACVKNPDGRILVQQTQANDVSLRLKTLQPSKCEKRCCLIQSYSEWKYTQNFWIILNLFVCVTELYSLNNIPHNVIIVSKHTNLHWRR